MRKDHLLTRDRPRIWQRALAGIYGFGWRAYSLWYRVGAKRPAKPPCKVVVVGNLTVGGTGKTPFVIAVVAELEAAGLAVVVSCSGYGGSRCGEVTLLELNETRCPSEIGEEPLLIRRAHPSVPIVIGRRRLAAVSAAYDRWHPDVVVLDDGLQHLPLARDLNIVLLNTDRPFGNGYLLPAGPLREPPSGLDRADAVVFIGGTNRSPSGDTSLAMKRLAAPVFTAERVVDSLRDARTEVVVAPRLLPESGIIAVSAIGDPGGFERTVGFLGLRVAETLRFADHHAYAQSDLQAIGSASRRYGSAPIVTTDKDYVKLAGRLPVDIPTYVVRIRVAFTDEFRGWLLDRVR